MRPLAALAPAGVRTGSRLITPDDAATLHAVEAAAVERAVDVRRREFATGRALLRSLLGTDVAIPVGPSRAPVLPAGVVGSLAHDRVLAVAAVTTEPAIAALGIDVEADDPVRRHGPDHPAPRRGRPRRPPRLLPQGGRVQGVELARRPAPRPPRRPPGDRRRRLQRRDGRPRRHPRPLRPRRRQVARAHGRPRRSAPASRRPPSLGASGRSQTASHPDGSRVVRRNVIVDRAGGRGLEGRGCHAGDQGSASSRARALSPSSRWLCR